jgi:apolipoprotein N-acyltransferase
MGPLNKENLTRCSLTLLSAILIVLSFPPYGIYPLIWVALIPWFFSLNRTKTWKQAFAQGVLLSFLMTVIGFYWVASVLKEFAELPSWLAIIGLCLFGLIGQPQFLVFAPIFRYLKNKSTESPSLRQGLVLSLCLAALYTGIDWMIPKLWVDTLGHSFWNAERLRQAADIGGASLLTVVIYWTNDSIWRALRKRRFWSVHVLVSVALIASLLIYGELRKNQIQSIVAQAKKHIQIGVIQANIGDFDKVASESGVQGASLKVLQKFFDMSDQALKQTPRPDALVWPETSYPTTFGTPSTINEVALDQSVKNFAVSRKTSLLFGGYDHREGKDYNAFFFLAPRASGSEATELQVYRKNILLLFGEYIPLSDTITFLRTEFPQVGNFGRGIGPDVLKIYPSSSTEPPVLAGPIICYEALFPSYIIGAARKGSQMILNITNDSWFGPYGEPILHFSLVTFRGIETRLPQVRSTNTGISALILPDGTLQARTQIGTEEIMNLSVPITDPIPTLMKTWGDWFGPFCFVMGLIMAVLFSRVAARSDEST